MSTVRLKELETALTPVPYSKGGRPLGNALPNGRPPLTAQRVGYFSHGPPEPRAPGPRASRAHTLAEREPTAATRPGRLQSHDKTCEVE